MGLLSGELIPNGAKATSDTLSKMHQIINQNRKNLVSEFMFFLLVMFSSMKMETTKSKKFGRTWSANTREKFQCS